MYAGSAFLYRIFVSDFLFVNQFFYYDLHGFSKLVIFAIFADHMYM